MGGKLVFRRHKSPSEAQRLLFCLACFCRFLARFDIPAGRHAALARLNWLLRARLPPCRSKNAHALEKKRSCSEKGDTAGNGGDTDERFSTCSRFLPAGPRPAFLPSECSRLPLRTATRQRRCLSRKGSEIHKAKTLSSPRRQRNHRAKVLSYRAFFPAPTALPNPACFAAFCSCRRCLCAAVVLR